MKTTVNSFIERIIRSSSLETEYEGFVKNTHKTLKLKVKCWIEDDFNGYEAIFDLPPLSEALVFSHSCGPTICNEYDFKIVEVTEI